MNEEDYLPFCVLLEQAGYQEAKVLIEDDLIPMARSQNISLLAAAWKYADQDEEQDTSWQQLFYALQGIPNSSLETLESIHRPLM